MTIRFTIHRKCVGKCGNAREHPMVKAKRYRGERASAVGAMLVQLGPDRMRGLAPPYVVTFTLVGPRARDDDNAISCCAAVRDEVARQLGYGDGPKDPISWRYSQRTGKDYAVEVEIRPANEEAMATP